MASLLHCSALIYTLEKRIWSSWLGLISTTTTTTTTTTSTPNDTTTRHGRADEVGLSSSARPDDSRRLLEAGKPQTRSRELLVRRHQPKGNNPAMAGHGGTLNFDGA